MLDNQRQALLMLARYADGFGEIQNDGELAQLARASALHAEGQRFESVILHRYNPSIDIDSVTIKYRDVLVVTFLRGCLRPR